MARKKNYKSELEEIKASIRLNSKDSHFADELIKKLLSTHKRSMDKPLPIYDLGKELGVFAGETFKVTKYENAVVWHAYNSYDYIVRPAMTSLYVTLCDLIDNQERYAELTGEEREAFDLNLSVIAYIMTAPTYCFLDETLAYDVATLVVKWLRTTADELLNQELQEETPLENEEFRRATISLEELKEDIADE